MAGQEPELPTRRGRWSDRAHIKAHQDGEMVASEESVTNGLTPTATIIPSVSQPSQGGSLNYLDGDGTAYAFRLRPGSFQVAIDGGKPAEVRSLDWEPATVGSQGCLKDQNGVIGRIPDHHCDKLRELAERAGIEMRIPKKAERHSLQPSLLEALAHGLSFDGAPSLRSRSERNTDPEWEEESDPKINTRRPRFQVLETLWDTIGQEEEPKMFQSLHIREDGGLCLTDLLDLWYIPGEPLRRWIFAVQHVVLSVANMVFLIVMDSMSIKRSFDKQKEYSERGLMDAILKSINIEINSVALVMMAELGLLTFLLLRCLRCAYVALTTKKEWHRWYCVSQVFFKWIPTVSTFSAMRLLANVNPVLLSLQIMLEFGFLRDRIEHGWVVHGIMYFLWFIFTRVLCLTIGLDAFLIKFRETSKAAGFGQQNEEVNWTGIAAVAFFMFQVLGVTNLTKFAKKRLTIFVFGGSDCKVSNREMGLNYFWNASLALRLWQNFTPAQFLAIMLTFDDFDFQRLLLGEKHTEASLRAVVGQSLRGRNSAAYAVSPSIYRKPRTATRV